MKKGFSILVMASLAMLTMTSVKAENKVVEDTKKADTGTSGSSKNPETHIRATASNLTGGIRLRGW